MINFTPGLGRDQAQSTTRFGQAVEEADRNLRHEARQDRAQKFGEAATAAQHHQRNQFKAADLQEAATNRHFNERMFLMGQRFDMHRDAVRHGRSKELFSPVPWVRCL